jgi:hypothetical protein
MRLVYTKTRAEVCVGDYATTHRGEVVQVESVTVPDGANPRGSVGVRFTNQGMPYGPEQALPVGSICAEWTDNNGVATPCEVKP